MGKLNFRTDADLDRFVRGYAKRNRLTVSQAARELLRQAMGGVSDVNRGWQEGFNKGYADAQKSLHEAAARKPLPGSR